MRRCPYRQRWRECRAIGVGRVRGLRRPSPGWRSIRVREDSRRNGDCLNHSDLLAFLELTLGQSKAANCKSRGEKSRMAHCSADEELGSDVSAVMILLV